MLLAVLSASRSYAQNWIQKAGGTTPDEASSISLDNSNNSYTTGYFSSTAHFGTSAVTASGVSDIFVTKINATGLFQWAVHAGGGANSDRGLCIKADANGNTYVTGYYSGTAFFGASNITSAGLQNIFVAKYSPSGALRWVVSAGGSQSDVGNGITVDNFGEVYITGQFAGTATFGSINLTSTNNNINVFIAKLDSSNGNFIWAKSGTGPHTDRGLAVACDQAGNAYVTGQFTDTITFTLPHYTSLSNSIFVVKYNRAGSEMWFTKAGGGSYNIANAITSDATSNIYLTGNFAGTLTFYANTTTTLSNTYANRIFVAKYDSNANLLWSAADGSSSNLTSNNIAVDNSGNPCIIGSFECVLNSYADRYGQGVFNTVGYWDIFISEYNSSAGAWQWSRQIGGHLNNYGNGIAVSSAGDAYVAGSFDQDIIITQGSNFSGYNTLNYNCNGAYCTDNNYGNFAYLNTYGNLDIFIAKPIDLTRQTYDYYTRTGSSCNRPFVGVCITDATVTPNCPDTLQFCQSGSLQANPNSCSNPPLADAGPNYTYVWSNNQTGGSVSASAPGWYSVTQTSVDGCFTSKDSVYVVIRGNPPLPTISDNVIINTNSTDPKNIRLCGDSVKLMGGNYAGYTYSWSEPGSATSPLATIEATSSGDYCFTITDTYGCSSKTCVTVRLDSAVKNIKPRLNCIKCSHDTIGLCKGSEFDLFAYDSISNPTALITKYIPPGATKVYWHITPSTINYSHTTNYVTDDNNYLLPADSGWYNIRAAIVEKNVCDSIKDTLTDSIFVRFYPLPPPINLSITGKTKLCPGDSTWLVAHGSTNYYWSTHSTNDSIRVSAGGYSVNSTITNSYGCVASGFAAASVSFVPQPELTTNPANDVICPGDSVKITCSGSGNYSWQGPSGPTGGNDSVIYIKNIGSYYCIESDTNGCLLLSNTVLLQQYTTPTLIASPAGIICPGDSAKLSVDANNGSLISWQPPLSGNNPVMYAKAPGTYHCNITACGITTDASVIINFADPIAQITPSGSKTFCKGDSITLSANTGLYTYIWNPGNSSSLSINVDTSGTYTLTTTDTNGCRAFDTITLATSKPLGHISPSQTVCFGTTVTLSVGGGTTYKWNTGASTSTIYVQPDSSSSYSVIVSNNIGCTDTVYTSVKVNQLAALSACCNDTIINGDTVTLHAYGNVSQNYKWSPGTGLFCTSCPSPIADPTVTTTYSVLRLDSNGCEETAMVTVNVEYPCADFIVPNVFTPNNDGINDDFVIRVQNVDYYSIVIYDRWGMEMYKSTNPNLYWNGKIASTTAPGNVLAPDGTYYYIIKAICNGNTYVKKGFVQLIGEK